MSRHDYEVTVQLWKDDTPFYALVMAAMLRADTDNAARLGAVFAATRRELQARYDAPGGRLPSDPDFEPVA